MPLPGNDADARADRPMSGPLASSRLPRNAA